MKSKNLSVALIAAGLLCSGVFTSCTNNASKEVTLNAAELTSDDPLENLKMGNARFVADKATLFHEDLARVKELTAGQHPSAIVITCSDSRVAPEIIFDQGLGDIFTIRTAGNVMGDYEEGSIEYAVEHCHSKLVVVMGHTSCGAVGALLEHAHDDDVPGHIASIVTCLKEEQEEQDALNEGGDDLPFNAVKANVLHGVRQLRDSDPILKEMYEKKEINIVGAIYHLENGQVEFLDI